MFCEFYKQNKQKHCSQTRNISFCPIYIDRHHVIMRKKGTNLANELKTKKLLIDRFMDDGLFYLFSNFQFSIQFSEEKDEEKTFISRATHAIHHSFIHSFIFPNWSWWWWWLQICFLFCCFGFPETTEKPFLFHLKIPGWKSIFFFCLFVWVSADPSVRRQLKIYLEKKTNI